MASTNTSTAQSSEQDLLSAVEVVTDYLTPTSRDLLWTALGFTADSFLAQRSNGGHAGNGSTEKRKKDWEMELEVIEYI